MNSIIPLHPASKRDPWRVGRHGSVEHGTGETDGKAAASAKAKAGAIRRVFGRTEPTTFHRCLAVHMYYAGRPSALD